MDIDLKEFTLPNETQVVLLDCKKAFMGLDLQEKQYAHYLSKAAWYGGLIVLVQTSPESPLIFSLLHQVFAQENINEIHNKVSEDISEEEFKAFLVYSCGVFSNMGNYKSFGDTKFIPNLPAEKFEKIIFCSSAYHNDSLCITSLWEKCKARIYSLKRNEKTLGFPDKGITTYFSSNCDESDSVLFNEFMKEYNIGAYNSRLFKTTIEDQVNYEIRLASSDKGHDSRFMPSPVEFKGRKFSVKRNDYAEILNIVVEYLQKAKSCVSSFDQEAMINKYISSFKSGDLEEHKDGSRYWIKDKSPIIETYIGFIETYRDPGGVRGEFEGFVAMVNREMSEKFKSLVSKAQELICRLPWNSSFEKDEFLQPDFTSLDVLTFSGSGIPAGINIPNYDEIRQEEGFKNVSLGNVIPATFKTNEFFFLSPADQELMTKYSIQAFEVQVGLHELLGHGSGKLFRKLKDGSFNFDQSTLINPLTDDKILSWYEEGETYDSIFSSISSSFEECRAECVGLYLSLDHEILKIFGYEGQEAYDIAYTNWLNLLWAGAGKALEMYQPESKSWLQAHSQARFVITQVLLEAGEGLFTVSEVKENEELLCKLDCSKMYTIGKKALGEFLQKLQVYKSTKNVEEATKMYKKYSEVNNYGPYPWARWRNIVLKHKKPKKMFAQNNTEMTDSGDVLLKEYEATYEGLIQSWVDRFKDEDIYEYLETIWSKDICHFDS